MHPEKSGGGGKIFRVVGMVVVHGQVWIKFGMFIKNEIVIGVWFPARSSSVLFRRTMEDL